MGYVVYTGNVSKPDVKTYYIVAYIVVCLS